MEGGSRLRSGRGTFFIASRLANQIVRRSLSGSMGDTSDASLLMDVCGFAPSTMNLFQVGLNCKQDMKSPLLGRCENSPGALRQHLTSRGR